MFVMVNPSINPKSAANKSTSILIAVGVIATFLLFRFYGLASQSLNQDEVVERQIAELPLEKIIHEPNSFPPLYHLLVRAWIEGIDGGEFALRTFSFACAALATVMMWGMCRDIFGERIATIAVWLTAGSAYHVYYSQQGRAYMLTLLLAVATTWPFLRLLRKASKVDWMWFVLAGTLGGYTHYYFSIYLLTLGLVALVQDFRFTLRTILPAGIAIGVLCLPLFALLKGDLEFQSELREPRPLTLASLGYTYFSFFSGYTLGPSRPELHVLPTKTAMLKALPWCLLVGVPFVWLTVSAGRRETWKNQLSMLIATFFPVGIVGLIGSIMTLTYNDRFLIWLVIPLTILLAVGFDRLKSVRSRMIVAALLLTTTISALFVRNHVEAHQNEDIRAIAETIQQQTEDGTVPPVLVSAGYVAIVADYYLSEPLTATYIMDNGIATGSTAIAIEQMQNKSVPFWFVYVREFHGDPEGEILRFVTETYNARQVGHFAGARLFYCANRNE